MFNYFLSELIRIRHNRLFQRAILIFLLSALFVIFSFILRFNTKEILIINTFYAFEFIIFIFGLIGGLGIVLIVYGDDVSYKTLDKVVFVSVPPIQFLITKIAIHALLVILSISLLYAIMIITILFVSDSSLWSNYINLEYLHRDFLANAFKMIGYGGLASVFTYFTKHNAITVFTYLFGFYGFLTDIIWIVIFNWFTFFKIDLYNMTLSQVAVSYASDITLKVTPLFLITAIYVFCAFLINLKILLSKK